MRKVVLYIVCIVLGLQACTKENMEDCFYGLKLNVAYLLPSGDDDAPAPMVRHVKAYVFDERDVLCAMGEGKGDCLSADCSINLGLPPGKYKVVVWGSDATDLLASYTEVEAAIGKTTLSTFRLSLKGELNEALAEFVPAERAFGDLYYGVLGQRASMISDYVIKEVVIPPATVVEQTIEVIRNTNQLNITVEGFEYLVPGWTVAASDIDVYVLGKGECYDTGNLFVGGNHKVKYTPYHKEINGNRFLFEIKTQRMRMDMKSEKPLLFYIYDKTKGKTLYELDVLEMLLKARDANGDYLYQSQEDLDRLYRHNIRLEITNPGGGDDASHLVIKVFINNWEITEMYPVP